MAHDSSQTVVSFQNSQSSVNVGGKQVALRADGTLKDLSEWTPKVAEALAALEELSLNDSHWQVINAMREYYQEFNLSPVKKLLKRSLRAKGAKDIADDRALERLFPRGVLQQGAKLAGVPVAHLDAELERETYSGNRAVSGNDEPFSGTFDFKGQSFEVSRTGNLIDLHRWNEDLAAFMAEREGITLTTEHWEVLNYLRRFYFDYGITPMVKILMKYLGEEYGVAKASRDYLYRLFPKGPSRQGSRIAGLPEPQGCIDG